MSRGRSLRLLLPPGAGRAGPQGLSSGAAGTELRPRSPHLVLGSPRPGRWLSAGIGGEPRRENVGRVERWRSEREAAREGNREEEGERKRVKEREKEREARLDQIGRAHV